MKTFIPLLLAIISREVFCLDNKRLLLHDPESIAAAINQLGAQINELNSTVAYLKATHVQDVAKLKAEHAQEVSGNICCSFKIKCYI